MKREGKFKIKIDLETIRELKVLIDYGFKNFPFMTINISSFDNLIRNIINNGCFKHSIFKRTIHTGNRDFLTFCPKFNPELQLKYKNDKDTDLEI